MSRDRALNTSYLERKLRAIGLQGSAPLQDLKDIQGLLVLESDRPEWRAAAGELLWGIGRNVGALAANNSFVGVHNRPRSGILTVVTRICISTATAATSFTIGVNFPDSGQPGDGIVFPKDLRVSLVAAIPATRRFEGQSVGGPPTSIITRGRVALDTCHVWEGAIILPPDSELAVVNVNVNQQIDVGIEGYERPLEGNWELK